MRIAPTRGDPDTDGARVSLGGSAAIRMLDDAVPDLPAASTCVTATR